jgi:3',5'-nucleoside bisphosphate phosphatase
MIDLHAHTTASDGSLTPAELVGLARETGLRALGVTDHDTIAGVSEAIAAGEASGVEVVPGVELSVEYPHGQFHLLGYLIDPDASVLRERLAVLQERRATRNDRMIARMQEGGLPITMADVVAEAGGGLVGRPHMALALVRQGIVASTQEAFDRFLGAGSPFNIPKERLSPEEAINLIHAARGKAVLAHPCTIKLAGEAFASEIARLRDLGLDGLEAYYSQHSPEQTAAFLAVAKRLSLKVTGGSDYHGRSKPHVRLGVVHGGRSMPYSVLEALRS